jgi:hypothetical protein
MTASQKQRLRMTVLDLDILYEHLAQQIRILTQQAAATDHLTDILEASIMTENANKLRAINDSLRSLTAPTPTAKPATTPAPNGTPTPKDNP